ncbi:MAG: PKD domain-containing protein [Desulfobacteraceae bacterium]|nr:PKD domain-containing protein [Desulfobacteraceae bacterium]
MKDMLKVKKNKSCYLKSLFIVTLVFILSCFTLSAAWAQFKFVAYGDSRSYPEDHDAICGLISSEDPELIINSGDLWDGYSSSVWKSHFTSRNNLNTLLNNNMILVARGNHETSSKVLDFSPDIVRENSITYSFLAANIFFVCLGMDPSASYLESQLQTLEAQNADFRIIYHHYPIYSAGSHGASGDSAIETICDKYEVTVSFAGHDHDYERSKVIYGQSVVYSGNDVPAGVKGTTYIVTGGGGAPLYPVGSKWWTDYSESIKHYCFLEAYSDRLEMKVVDINGSVIETFIRRKTSSSVQVSLTASVVGQGSISPSTGSYDQDSTLSMTATPAAGWVFDCWTGDLTGSDNPQDLLMDNDKIVTATFIKVGGVAGITQIGEKSSAPQYRRAMPVIMPEDGVIESVTQYHAGGSGNMYLAVYDGTSSKPENRIAITPLTTVSSSTGWQTIKLTDPVWVENGDQIWLSWVYEDNPGTFYYNGTPGRVKSDVGWSGGMPDLWGSIADAGNFRYSIYATYSTGSNIEPTAEFMADFTTIEVGEKVTFTDQSTGGPASWSWTFEGGSPENSTSENPVVAYNTAGVYPVSLTVSNSAGSDTETKDDYITVDESVTAVVLEANTSGGAKMDIKDDQMGSQSFIHGASGDPDYKIKKIVLHLSRDSELPDEDMLVSIGTDVNAGALDGSEYTIEPSEIKDTSGGSAFTEYEIVYPATVGPLTAGVKYYLNIDGSAPNGKPYYTEYSEDDVYANGTYYKDFSDDEKDMWFQILGN